MARELSFTYGDEEISVVGGQNGTSGLIEGSCLKKYRGWIEKYKLKMTTHLLAGI
jgi:hypothetical protein